MSVPCDLQVDVNGEEVFWVNKKIISAFSGRLSKICNNSPAKTSPKMLKVILHDFPGGPEMLDLILRFCYNHGKLMITPAKASLLNFAAHFMDMTQSVASTPNLVEQTDEFLNGVSYWTWSEVLVALRQCQDHLALADSSGLLDRVLDSLVSRINLAGEMSPLNSSPECSGFRLSFDTRSTLSVKNSSRRAWWFDDLVALKLQVMENIVRRMITAKIEHQSISWFLLYFLKTRLTHCTSDVKRKIMEIVIDMLYQLHGDSISCKGLFWILRLSLPLNLDQCTVTKLVAMIGCQLDLATLDNILVPASSGSDSLYDVNLVLGFIKSFLSNGGVSSIARLKRVGCLMDLYLAEVAPDPCLKFQKFFSLATALCDPARDSHDGLYQAIDMYIQVHSGLSEEHKIKVCSILNYEKLSSEALKHLAQNSKLPSRAAIQALVSQQYKLKRLLQDTNNCESLMNSPCADYVRDEQIVLYAKKLDMTTSVNGNLKVRLRRMQWRVVELENICRKLQLQVTKLMKGGKQTVKGTKSLPRLCK